METIVDENNIKKENQAEEVDLKPIFKQEIEEEVIAGDDDWRNTSFNSDEIVQAITKTETHIKKELDQHDDKSWIVRHIKSEDDCFQETKPIIKEEPQDTLCFKLEESMNYTEESEVKPFTMACEDNKMSMTAIRFPQLGGFQDQEVLDKMFNVKVELTRLKEEGLETQSTSIDERTEVKNECSVNPEDHTVKRENTTDFKRDPEELESNQITTKVEDAADNSSGDEHLQVEQSYSEEEEPPSKKKKRSRASNISQKPVEKTIQCEKCEMQFAYPSQLIRHEEAAHERAFQFHCTKCARGFRSRGQLVTHESTNCYKLRPLTCKVCNRGFRFKHDLTAHTVSNCGNKELSPFLCEVCGKKFLKNFDLQRHIQTKCQTLSLFKCKICNKAYKVKQGLREHEENKCGTLKRFVCGKCGKGFRVKASLVVHVASDCVIYAK